MSEKQNYNNIAEELINTARKNADKLSPSMDKSVQVETKPKLIEFKKETLSNKETTKEQAKTIIDFLIDTCGEEKINDRVKVFEETLKKFPKLIDHVEIRLNQTLAELKEINDEEFDKKKEELAEINERFIFLKSVLEK